MSRLFTDEAERGIAEMYRSGHGVPAIRRRFGGSAKAVHNAMKRQGVVSRVHTGGLVANEAAFADPSSSPTAAYFVGLLLTDGWIVEPKNARQSYKIGLALTATDDFVIRRFREFMGASNSITFRPPAERVFVVKRVYSRRGVSSLVFRSNIVATDLIKLGVTPRKTGTEAAPDCLLGSRDFWRGCVDGDGSVSVQWGGGKNGNFYPNLSLCGTKVLVSQFRDFAAKHAKFRAAPTRSSSCRTLYNMTFTGRSAVKILSALYKDGDLALPRKASIAASAIGQKA